MATMMERKAESIRKEIEKYEQRKVRAIANLEKKNAICEKLGCAWTEDEWFGGKRDTGNDKQITAYIDRSVARMNLKDIEGRLESEIKRLEKISGKVDAQQEKRDVEEQEKNRAASIEAHLLTVEELKAKTEAYHKWLEEFKADCLKDGVKIDEVGGSYFTGWTKNGKRFILDGNNGWTTRSRHCYSLRIDGESIFTSGEFYTAYRYLKNH